MASRSVLLRLLLAALMLLVIGLQGCALEDEAVSGDASKLEVPGNSDGPGLFRDDFYTYLRDEDGYSDDAIRDLVLVPPPQALAPHVAVDPSAPLRPYDDAFASMAPVNFYRLGRVAPFKSKNEGARLENQLRNNPIHIVVVPGIFGELIPVTPFEEVFQRGGTAQRRWNEKIKQAVLRRSAAGRARQYSMMALGDVERPLDELFRVGSIDAADGTPLVTVTYLKPSVGSLETFGSLDDNVDYYLPRLSKYFELTGVPEHLYFLGYSRGEAVALDLVSRAATMRASWLPKLKGVMSLAGVVYGSEYVDAALRPGAERALIDLTTDFVENKLASCKDGKDGTANPVIVTANAGHWTAYLARAAVLLPGLTSNTKALAREGIETGKADIGRLALLVRRALFGANAFGTADDDTSAAEGMLRLDAPIRDYCENIERLKVFERQLMKGIRSLSTDERVAWWRTHTLPEHVRHFALTATMGDPTDADGAISPLTLNPAAYDTRSIDFRALRSSYYDLLGSSGQRLQDGQISTHRSRFWPELHRTLNPRQKPFKTYFMGTIGSHHWGLAFPQAFSTKGVSSPNPFPRTVLLKSMATFAAQIEQSP